MGDSSSEIDQQIKETRKHLDENIVVLEHRAASRARHIARAAAVVGAGLVAGAAIGFGVYRLRRRRSPVARIHDVVPGAIRRAPRRVLKGLKRPLPTVKVVIGDPSEPRAPSPWRSTAEKVATTVAVSTATALASRILRSRDAGAAPHPPQ